MSDPHFSLKKKQMSLFTTGRETREMKYKTRMFTVERGRQKEGDLPQRYAPNPTYIQNNLKTDW